MSFTDLATKINEVTGMEGKELEAFTFLYAAVYADMMGRKDIGDYFQKRMNEASKQAWGAAEEAL